MHPLHSNLDELPAIRRKTRDFLPTVTIWLQGFLVTSDVRWRSHCSWAEGPASKGISTILNQNTCHLSHPNTLARRSAEFHAETQPGTIEAIQQQIPGDAALVELVRYEPFNAAASQQERWGAPRYAAYVLLPSGEILTVDLGDAAALEAQVFAFREALRNPNSNIHPLARELDAHVANPDYGATAIAVDSRGLSPVADPGRAIALPHCLALPSVLQKKSRITHKFTPCILKITVNSVHSRKTLNSLTKLQIP